MPKFSIILPCYNAEETLNATIASIKGQSFTDWELICVDDGSQDFTLKRLHEWMKHDPRVRVLPQEKQGPSAARNRGASAAKGEILCFCDADDLWVNTKLSELAKAFETPTTDGVYGQIAFFKRKGHAETYSTVGPGPLSINELMGENPVCTMSNFAVRREIMEASGGFAEALVHNEDLEWLIRIIGMGAVIKPLNSLQVWYRTSTGGLSSDLRKMAHSRRLAMTTAARFGYRPSARNEAIYLRYLARRALRLERGRGAALGLVLQGLVTSPSGFLYPFRRGGATALAALIAPVVPNPLLRRILSK